MVEWLRQSINNGTERGQQEWEQLVLWLNTPPVQARAVAAARPRSAAAVLRAQAEAQVGREDAAFAAFAGAAGR